MNEKSDSENTKEKTLELLGNTIGDLNTMSATIDALSKLTIEDIMAMQEGKFDNFEGSTAIDDLELPEGPYFLHYTPRNEIMEPEIQDIEPSISIGKEKNKRFCFLNKIKSKICKTLKN
ncbi:hypothetical protein [Priestia aryabhattai]